MQGFCAMIAAADAGPEEPDQAALLLLLGQLSVLPGVAEIQQRIEIDLVEVVNALRSALQTRNCLRKIVSSFESVEDSQFPARASARYASTALLDSDSWFPRLDRGDLFGRQSRRDTRLRRGWHSQNRIGRHLRRRPTRLSQRFGQLPAKFLCRFPAMGLCALADELTVVRSPYPLGAVAAAPGFVAGILTIWDGGGYRQTAWGLPDFSSRLCSICRSGAKILEGDCTVTVQFWSDFSVRI